MTLINDGRLHIVLKYRNPKSRHGKGKELTMKQILDRVDSAIMHGEEEVVILFDKENISELYGMVKYIRKRIPYSESDVNIINQLTSRDKK